MKWFLRACPICGGDLHEDIEDRGWVACFMCARSFPATEVQAVVEATTLPSTTPASAPLPTAA